MPNVVLMALIICGGLGFLVWDDVLTKGLHPRRWRLHSKIVITATAVLLVGGTAAFYFLERDGAFSGVPEGQKVLMAAFQSVTPRTAGFNTVDLMALSESATLLTMMLMFVGAGSGSTGGGIKVNTFAVLVLETLSQIRRKEDVNVFRRPPGRGNDSPGPCIGDHVYHGVPVGLPGAVPPGNFPGECACMRLFLPLVPWA